MKLILETERLRLREFTLEDARFILNLFNSPGWLQFIGDRDVNTEKDAKSFIQNNYIKNYKVLGYGFYMVEMKKDGNGIGLCGIVKRKRLECPEIGFAFLPEYMGLGYAYEIVKSTLDYSLYTFNLKKIGAITFPGNIRSIKLLEKIGFCYKRPIIINNEELLIYINKLF